MINVKLAGSKRYDTHMAIHTETNKHISLAGVFQKHPPNSLHKNDVIDQGKYRKCDIRRKCNDCGYHVQENGNVAYTSEIISCDKTQFPEFPLCGTHSKPNGV